MPTHLDPSPGLKNQPSLCNASLTDALTQNSVSVLADDSAPKTILLKIEADLSTDAAEQGA